MNSKELFDACMKVSEFAADRHDRRREYEWKVTLGLWAVIVGAILSFKERALPLWIVVGVALLYAFCWLRGLSVSNELDKRVSQHYRDEAEKLLLTSGTVSPSSIPRPNLSIPVSWRRFGFLTIWSFQFQLAVTLLLLIAAYIFIQPAQREYTSALPADSTYLLINESSSAPLRPAVEERLYFGRGSAKGRSVSQAGWRRFLREVVTPRFPTGLTVLSAQGQWRDSTGTITSEESFVLDIIHPRGADVDLALNEIVETYKRQFHQQAVLRVRGSVHIGF